jgi:CheY-like chemotaxis protein
VKFNFSLNLALNKKKKILIVEDEPMSVLLMQQLLQPYQFELIVAVDGLDAIEKFKNHKVDLVIMDLYMPNMDGFEASKKIKVISKETPIIVISTTAIPEEELKRDIGIDYFLAKPLNTNKFRDFIHMLLLS